jgi:hypothetical protein
MAAIPDVGGNPVRNGYSKEQWMSLPEGKRGFKTYQRYRQWWNQRFANRTSTIADRKAPVAGMGSYPPGMFINFHPLQVPKYPAMPGYFKAIANSVLNQQATQRVHSQIDPVLAQITKQYAGLEKTLTDRFGRERSQGESDIQGSTANYIAALQGQTPALEGIYNQAISEQQNVGAGVQAFLQGRGQQLMGQAQQDAAQAGATPGMVQALAGPEHLGGQTVANEATGIADTSGALGELSADKAASLAYAAGLPASGQAYGLQALTGFLRDVGNRQTDALADLTNQRTGALGEVTSRVPGLVQEVFQSLLDREGQKAEARANWALGKQGQVLDVRKANQAARQAADIFNAGTLGDLATAAGADPVKWQLKNVRSGNGYDQYAFNPVTREWELVGHTQVPVKPGAGGGPSASVRAGINKDAFAFAQGMLNRMVPGTGDINPITGKPDEVKRSVSNPYAYQRMVEWFKQQYPNMQDAKILDQARRTLVAAGYTHAHDDMANLSTLAQFNQMLVNRFNIHRGPAAPPGAENPARTPLTSRGPKTTTAPGTPTKPGKPATTTTKPPKPQTVADKAKTATDQAVANANITKNAASDAKNQARYGMNMSQLTSYLIQKYKINQTQANEIARAAIIESRKQ